MLGGALLICEEQIDVASAHLSSWWHECKLKDQESEARIGARHESGGVVHPV